MDNSRAGIASFTARVELEDLRLDCNPVHLNGETSWNTAEGETIEGDYEFVDMGGNLCSCQGIDDGCHVLSTGIEAPKLTP
ncbi:MAG: hypothetical protein JRI68_13160 [Deltaproteobacteria bacterium]|nr:hypothetical protein [Deltaproteobacteria bacterium]